MQSGAGQQQRRPLVESQRLPIQQGAALQLQQQQAAIQQQRQATAQQSSQQQPAAHHEPQRQAPVQHQPPQPQQGSLQGNPQNIPGQQQQAATQQQQQAAAQQPSPQQSAALQELQRQAAIQQQQLLVAQQRQAASQAPQRQATVQHQSPQPQQATLQGNPQTIPGQQQQASVQQQQQATAQQHSQQQSAALQELQRQAAIQQQQSLVAQQRQAAAQEPQRQAATQQSSQQQPGALQEPQRQAPIQHHPSQQQPPQQQPPLQQQQQQPQQQPPQQQPPQQQPPLQQQQQQPQQQPPQQHPPQQQLPQQQPPQQQPPLQQQQQPPQQQPPQQHPPQQKPPQQQPPTQQQHPPQQHPPQQQPPQPPQHQPPQHQPPQQQQATLQGNPQNFPDQQQQAAIQQQRQAAAQQSSQQRPAAAQDPQRQAATQQPSQPQQAALRENPQNIQGHAQATNSQAQVSNRPQPPQQAVSGSNVNQKYHVSEVATRPHQDVEPAQARAGAQQSAKGSTQIGSQPTHQQQQISPDVVQGGQRHPASGPEAAKKEVGSAQKQGVVEQPPNVQNQPPPGSVAAPSTEVGSAARQGQQPDSTTEPGSASDILGKAFEEAEAGDEKKPNQAVGDAVHDDAGNTLEGALREVDAEDPRAEKQDGVKLPSIPGAEKPPKKVPRAKPTFRPFDSSKILRKSMELKLERRRQEKNRAFCMQHSRYSTIKAKPTDSVPESRRSENNFRSVSHRSLPADEDLGTGWGGTKRTICWHPGVLGREKAAKQWLREPGVGSSDIADYLLKGRRPPPQHSQRWEVDKISHTPLPVSFLSPPVEIHVQLFASPDDDASPSAVALPPPKRGYFLPPCTPPTPDTPNPSDIFRPVGPTPRRLLRLKRVDSDRSVGSPQKSLDSSRHSVTGAQEPSGTENSADEPAGKGIEEADIEVETLSPSSPTETQQVDKDVNDVPKMVRQNSKALYKEKRPGKLAVSTPELAAKRPSSQRSQKSVSYKLVDSSEFSGMLICEGLQVT